MSIVNQYDAIRKCTFAHISTVVLDKSMSTWRPRTNKIWGLPHFTYQQCKPEPLGIEFKVIACGITGCLLNLEIMRASEHMKK